MLGRVHALAQRLGEYPETVASATRELAPHAIAFYLRALAGEFHSYYNAEEILVEDGSLWMHIGASLFRVGAGFLLAVLFAVLLGGATALLPIYARDILAVGPAGLGLLPFHHLFCAPDTILQRGDLG